MKKLILFLLINFFAILYSYSQNTFIGASFGYGSGYLSNQAKFIQLFSEDVIDNYEFSGLVSYKPRKTVFSINSGITYQMFSLQGEHLRFLRIPLELDFQFGKKYYFLIGFGLYAQSFTNSSMEINYEFSDFQAGFNTKIGIGYVLNDKYSFCVKVPKDNEISGLYREEKPTHSGSVDYENIYSFKYSLNICFYYKLKRRKENGI